MVDWELTNNDTQVEKQLDAAMEQLQGLGADMDKKHAVSKVVKRLRKEIAEKVRTDQALTATTTSARPLHCLERQGELSFS